MGGGWGGTGVGGMTTHLPSNHGQIIVDLRPRDNVGGSMGRGQILDRRGTGLRVLFELLPGLQDRRARDIGAGDTLVMGLQHQEFSDLE